MYSSHHSGEFETYDLVLYEPVIMVENFQYKTLVLIGEYGRGVNSAQRRRRKGRKKVPGLHCLRLRLINSKGNVVELGACTNMTINSSCE